MSKTLVASIIIILLMSRGPSDAELPTLAEVEESIQTIEYCTEIHLWWIKYIEEYGLLYPECGDIEHHQRWVDDYNQTLTVLYKLKTALESLNETDSQVVLWR